MYFDSLDVTVKDGMQRPILKEISHNIHWDLWKTFKTLIRCPRDAKSQLVRKD